ncbi:MAG: cold shock domain-containing protein [Pirellula sp.]
MRIGQIINVIADRKFGFIRTEHFRDDVFFHFSTLKNINPKRLRIGQEVEFEIDELLRINKQKLEAVLVQEPAEPLSARLEEENHAELRAAHHPRARRRKPSWKAKADAAKDTDGESPTDGENAATDAASPALPSEGSRSDESTRNG